MLITSEISTLSWIFHHQMRTSLACSGGVCHAVFIKTAHNDEQKAQPAVLVKNSLIFCQAGESYF